MLPNKSNKKYFFQKKIIRKITFFLSFSLGIIFIFKSFLVSAQAPSAPEISSVSTACLAINSPAVSLSWQYLDSEIEDYWVYRNDILVRQDVFAGSPPPIGSFFSWTDYLGGGDSGNIYTYKLVARNSAYELSDPSIGQIIAAPFCDNLPEITDSFFSCDINNNPQIELSWIYPSEIHHFDIHRSIAPNDPFTEGVWIDQVAAENSDYIDKAGLSENKTYRYQIIMYGNSNWALDSNIYEVETISCSDIINPSPNPELNVYSACDSVNTPIIKLNWTSSNNTHYYKIHKYSETEGSSEWIKDYFTNFDTDYGDSPVITQGEEYFYSVEAINNTVGSISAHSATSSAVAISCAVPVEPPDAPSNLSAANFCFGSDSEIKLTWSEPTAGGQADRYFVYRLNT